MSFSIQSILNPEYVAPSHFPSAPPPPDTRLSYSVSDDLDVGTGSTCQVTKKPRLPKTSFTHEDNLRIYDVGIHAPCGSVTEAFGILASELKKTPAALRLHFYHLKRTKFDPDLPPQVKQPKTSKVEKVSTIHKLLNPNPIEPRTAKRCRTSEESRAFTEEIVKAIDSGVKCRELADLHQTSRQNIRSKYFRATKLTVNKKFWTKERQEILRQALQTYPDDFKMVSEKFFPEMKPEQIKRKSIKLLKKYDRSPFTLEEKQRVMDNYASFTNKRIGWTDMAKALFPNRDPEDLKSFFNANKERQAKALETVEWAVNPPSDSPKTVSKNSNIFLLTSDQTPLEHADSVEG